MSTAFPRVRCCCIGSYSISSMFVILHYPIYNGATFCEIGTPCLYAVVWMIGIKYKDIGRDGNDAKIFNPLFNMY
jgi:hypothetical protein